MKVQKGKDKTNSLHVKRVFAAPISRVVLDVDLEVDLEVDVVVEAADVIVVLEVEL